MLKAVIILLISIGIQNVKAQDFYSISGKITDSTGIALYPATIVLISGLDTLKSFTREDGHFLFKQIRNRMIKLHISMKGYLPLDTMPTINTAQRSVQLQTLTLRISYSELDPAIITSVRPITITGDTVSYNTAAFPVPDGSEVEDILKRLPGIEVDMDGNVIVQGKKVTKLLVDGKEFFGGDVLLAIRNLPADVVSKLQLIDDYGDNARLTGIRIGDPQKILNVVLQPDKRNGLFGRAESGQGEQGKYSDNTFANAFNGDRQASANGSFVNNNPAGYDPTYAGEFNYANKWGSKIDASFDGSTRGWSARSVSSSLQENFYPGEQLQQNQDNQNGSSSNQIELKTRLNFRPNNYSTIRLLASGNINQSVNQVSSNYTTHQEDSGFSKTTSGQSQTHTGSNEQNLNENLYYEHLFRHSRQRFNFTIDFGINGSHQLNDNQSNAAVLSDSISASSFFHYLITNAAQNHNLNFNGTYFFPLTPRSFLECGFRTQSAISRSNFLTQQPDSLTNLPKVIDSLSQNNVFSNISQSLHTSYSAQLRNINFSAGFDAEKGELKGTTALKGNITSFSYFSLLPNVQAVWAIDKANKLNINYNGGPNLPGLQQLSPIINLTNPQYPVIGNPNLKPSYTHNATLHFEHSRLRAIHYFGYGLDFGYRLTENPIISNHSFPQNSTQIIQTTTYLNTGTSSIMNLGYHLTLPPIIGSHLQTSFSGNLVQSESPTMTDSLPYTLRSWTAYQVLHLLFLLPNRLEMEFQGEYSVTHSVLPSPGNLPNTIKSASTALKCRYYFFKSWILNYQLSEPFTGSGNRLQATPISLNASLQRQILHKKGTIILSGYNLLNQSTGIAQYSTPTSFTQNRSVLIGRYFLLSAQFKFNHFHK